MMFRGRSSRPRAVSSSVDGYAEGVVGLVVGSALGCLDRCAFVQRYPPVVVHHYMIHKRGLPHIAFRRNYLSQLRALLPLQMIQPADGVVPPDSSISGSLRTGESPEVVDKSHRTTRRAFQRRRPVCVMGPPVENIPVLTIQGPLAVAGAVVLDCRPSLLPVSIDISGVDLSAGRLPVVLAGVDILPHEREPLFSGGLLGLICPELGVAPLVDPGTDELPTPVDKSVPISTSSGVDLELARALLEVGVLPAMVTPIVDPEVGSSMTPAGYPVPPILELSVMVSVPLRVASPAGPAGGSPARNESLLGQVSPPGSVVQAPTSPVLRSTPDVSPPSGLAPIIVWTSVCHGVFCSRWGRQRPPLCFRLPSLLVGWWRGSLSLGRLWLPRPGRRMWLGGPPSMPNLSREGPFDVHQNRSASGASPRVLDGMQGCQYRMTSYDEQYGGPDFSPAYGIQLHDPRLLEYVGAPESTRLLSHSPESGLHHLGHEKTLAAALQLQHDVGLILSNVHVLQ